MTNEGSPSAEELAAEMSEMQSLARRTTPAQRQLLLNQFRVLRESVRPFRLLDLPPELRDRIYASVVITDGPLLLPSACKHPAWQDAAQPAITRVNRQLRAETLPMFYSTNVFEAHIHSLDFGYFLGFMQVIGGRNVKKIHQVTIALPCDSNFMECATGLLDLVRWCATDNNSGHMQFSRGTYYNENSYLVHGAIALAMECYDKHKEYEPRLREAFREWLTTMDMHCTCPKSNGGFGCSMIVLKEGVQVSCGLSQKYDLK